MAFPAHNVFDLLVRAAQGAPDRGVTVLPQGWTDTSTPERFTYPELLEQACSTSRLVQDIPGIDPSTIVLLHLDNHRDNILWLWAIIASGLVPAISTPFTNDLAQRRKHLLHLNDVLESPIVITREGLVPEFASVEGTFRIFTIESLAAGARTGDDATPAPAGLEAVLRGDVCAEARAKEGDDLFALMLTSGSTGNAKAVRLHHSMVLAAVAGKAAHHETTGDDVFLNWIGMDHVANLTECHLHAMSLGAEQAHVHAIDLLSDPMLFLHLIDGFRVSYTFAPNFFLASVKKSLELHLETPGAAAAAPPPDLSTLRCLISGGEANPTALAAALSKLLTGLGAARHVLRPGFGMTETCAGSIYNLQCPTADRGHGREFTSLGHCVPGMQMRVTKPTLDSTRATAVLAAGQEGNLEIRGANVFRGYHNNAEATAASFSWDGWFITGDLALVDERGFLHLVGREKETININGVKHFPHEIEAAVEEAGIAGLTPSWTAVFPHRPAGAATESLCVVFLPAYAADDDGARLATRGAIRSAVMRVCLARPHRIIPLDRALLHKTALGKLSRSKIAKAFEAGLYAPVMAHDETRLAGARRACIAQPATDAERAVRAILADILDLPPAEVGTEATFYDLGCSSLEMLQLKSRVERCAALGRGASSSSSSSSPSSSPLISITTIITNPTVRSLCAALDARAAPKAYDPVVTLRSGGAGAPLWLVHPGMGEVLIFLGLVRCLPADRPVYALRARGFEDGEPFFASIDEMAETYVAAMRRVQPSGPYALAGYSFGGTVAFEMTKKLTGEGAELPFLCIFDQPPRIRRMMSVGGWGDALRTLGRFFDLVPQAADRQRLATDLRQLEASGDIEEDEGLKERMVDRLLESDPNRVLLSHGLDKRRLVTWASVAHNSHIIGREYEPRGKVPRMDVLYAGEPIASIAATSDEWLERYLSGWREFADDVNFHGVEGHHYILMGPAHVATFARTLTSRLEARGL
ncbi:hypothetical protein GGR56DRAFT_618274 [Xylariaceae sp. FL0804]|nr:hypothetical protein GGR56DRAFT_618274 [Xylariaceae sp. FL0804]